MVRFHRTFWMPAALSKLPLFRLKCEGPQRVELGPKCGSEGFCPITLGGQRSALCVWSALPWILVPQVGSGRFG